MKYITLLFLVIILLPTFLAADDDFEWLPINESDWSRFLDIEDVELGAIILFERIETDDTNLLDNECYYTIYRRMRILSHKGRDYGDIQVPFLSSEQEIEEIKGRTILADGTIISLEEKHIFEKSFLKSSEIDINQKSFFLPGVSDNCVIEYRIKIQLKNPTNLWNIEKDLFMKYGQFLWRFYRGKGLGSGQYKILSDYVSPNYIVLNNNKLEITFEQKPNIKDPKEILITVDSVNSFKGEPMSLPSSAIKVNLRLFYGDSKPPSAFWGDKSHERSKTLGKFTEENDELEKIIETFKSAKSSDEKIQMVYNWVQNSILNTSYDNSNDEFEDNESVNDVIDNRYGSSSDINKVFYDMLREMNIKAVVCYVVDRDENLLEKQAKYWQYNRSLVAVEFDQKQYKFYNPGAKLMPIEQIHWYSEGIMAFMIGDMATQFRSTPISKDSENKSVRNLILTISDSLDLNGKISEVHKGHKARSLRLSLDESTQRERNNYLYNHINKNYKDCDVDSFSIKGNEDIGKKLKITCNTKFGVFGTKIENRIFIRPYSVFKEKTNPFIKSNRQSLLVFPYSYTTIDAITLELPKNWTIEAIPENLTNESEVGILQYSYLILDGGRKVSIQRLKKLKRPYFVRQNYNKVKQFYKSIDYHNGAILILKKTEDQ